MFRDLKLYVVIEKVLLLESSKHYENRAKTLILTGNAHDYMTRVRQYIKFEEEQLSVYFLPKTQAPLLKVVRSELIDKNAHVIWQMFEKSFVTDNVMLSDNKLRGQALKSLYYFLSNMGSIELLQLLIGSYYEQKGNLAYMKNTHDWYGLVDSLVRLRGEINTIVEGGHEDERMEPGFSEKLSVMLEDISISQKLNRDFKNFCSIKENLEVFVNVLTLNSWPNYLTKFDSPLRLPLNNIYDIQIRPICGHIYDL
ncbi:737_t:CDS:2 [Acaulospora colombiana]|uniref:737_t:CDS:1 n=1 Tax=Acaulospora colombiana TaxID=27376 RepID=A0ACA9MG29_9GLOM|nr:737_t:CDS:2 [Acaulospora colombiana]